MIPGLAIDGQFEPLADKVLPYPPRVSVHRQTGRTDAFRSLAASRCAASPATAG